MEKNSFLQVVKLPNVRGRVRYISDPKRQENLYATFTMWSQNIGLTSQKKIRRISEKAAQRANALRRES